MPAVERALPHPATLSLTVAESRLLGYDVARSKLGRAALNAMPASMPTWEEYCGFTASHLDHLHDSLQPEHFALLRHLADGGRVVNFRYRDIIRDMFKAQASMQQLRTLTHTLSPSHCMRRSVELHLITPPEYTPPRNSRYKKSRTSANAAIAFGLFSRGWSDRHIIEHLRPDDMKSTLSAVSHNFSSYGKTTESRIATLLGAGILLPDQLLIQRKLDE